VNEVTSLNKKETQELVFYKHVSQPLQCEELKAIVENCERWDTQITVLSFFLSQVLENILATDRLDVINTLYTLDENMFININEINYKFIEYMLNHVNVYGDIEAFLVILSEKFESYEYDKSLRL
jgi:hypothetical protein